MKYRTAHSLPLDNEGRADWAEQAIVNGSDAEAQDLDLNEYPQTVEQDVSDLLANVIHFCIRAGLDWDSVVERAERAAVGDLEDSPETVRDADRFPDQEG